VFFSKRVYPMTELISRALRSVSPAGSAALFEVDFLRLSRHIGRMGNVVGVACAVLFATIPLVRVSLRFPLAKYKTTVVDAASQVHRILQGRKAHAAVSSPADSRPLETKSVPVAQGGRRATSAIELIDRILTLERLSATQFGCALS
jgi:hypothetical protein